MRPEEPDRFRIRMDDENPEALPREDLKTHKIDQIGRRVTLLAILLPCIFGLMVLAGFFELRKRLDNSRVDNTAAVSGLYKDTETRMNTLTEEIRALEAKLIVESTGLEKILTDLKSVRSDVEKMESSVKSVQKAINTVEKSVTSVEKTVKSVEASAVTKKDQEKTLESIKNQMATVQPLVQNMKKDLQDRNDSLSKRIAGISAGLSAQEKSLSDIRDTINRIDENKVDATAVRQAVRAETSQFSQAIEKLKKDFNSLQIELIRVQSQKQGTQTTPSNPQILEQTIE